MSPTVKYVLSSSDHLLSSLVVNIIFAVISRMYLTHHSPFAAEEPSSRPAALPDGSYKS